MTRFYGTNFLCWHTKSIKKKHLEDISCRFTRGPSPYRILAPRGKVTILPLDSTKEYDRILHRLYWSRVKCIDSQHTTNQSTQSLFPLHAHTIQHKKNLEESSSIYTLQHRASCTFITGNSWVIFLNKHPICPVCSSC